MVPRVAVLIGVVVAEAAEARAAVRQLHHLLSGGDVFLLLLFLLLLLLLPGFNLGCGLDRRRCPPRAAALERLDALKPVPTLAVEAQHTVVLPRLQAFDAV